MKEDVVTSKAVEKKEKKEKEKESSAAKEATREVKNREFNHT